jgi:hypothetical protein
MEIEFGKLPVGAVFFDSYSGEDWQKLSENEAKLCLDCSTETDYFNPEEIVEFDDE